MWHARYAKQCIFKLRGLNRTLTPFEQRISLAALNEHLEVEFPDPEDIKHGTTNRSDS